MEDKGQNVRKELSLEEQKKINPETVIGSVPFVYGFNGVYETINKHTGERVKCGGAAILRSDGKHHTESLEELEKIGVYPI